MARVTRFSGGVAAGGANSGATSAGAIFSLPLSFDPTSATQVLCGYLPVGATPLLVIGFGGATGGTNPTVDIGSAGDDDGYANELDADAAGTSTAAGVSGALMNTRITAVTAVYGKVGASAATGGTFKGALLYTITDA